MIILRRIKGPYKKEDFCKNINEIYFLYYATKELKIFEDHLLERNLSCLTLSKQMP